MMKFSYLKRLGPKWDIAAILAAISVYLGLLLPILGRDSAYFDEGYSAYLAHLGLFDMAWYTALDVHPPLYYAVLHFWQMIVGTDVAQLRLLSVLFGAVVVIFVFLIARRWFGRASAYLALGIITFSPLFLRYSEAMRMYTMSMALCLAATYVLLIAATRPAKSVKKMWLIYAVLVSAGMWTNYFTALVFVTHGLWMWYERRADIKRYGTIWKTWLWAVGIAILLYLPWLPMLLWRYADVQATGFWVQPISINILVSTITMSTVYRDAIGTTSWLAAGVITVIGGTIWLAPKAYHSFDPLGQRAFRLITALTILPPLLLAIGSLPPLRSSYVYRYTLFAVIMSAIMIGVVIMLAPLGRRSRAIKSLCILILFVVLGSGVIKAQASGSRSLDTNAEPMIGQVVKHIHEISDTPEVIIVKSPYTYYAARLYTTTSYPVYFVEDPSLKNIGSARPLYDHPGDSGITNLAQFAHSHDRLWYASEDRYNNGPPPGDWHVGKHFVLYDHQYNRPAGYGTEYVRN